MAMDIPIDPSSESEALRASAILLIRIAGAEPRPWVDEHNGLLTREVVLNLQIEEVLKGEVRQAVREPFQLTVVQRRSSGPRISDHYGLWSYVPLEEGTELLAFCRGDSDDARVLLSEENCEQLWDDPESLRDTRAALELEAAGFSPLNVLAAAEAQAAERGPIFARYVMARSNPAATSPVEPALAVAPAGQAAMAAPAPDAFELLMQLLEDPRTPALARDAYLTSTLQALALTNPPPPDRVARLIEALNRLLLLPEAASLHQTIRDVYLPNLSSSS